MADWVEANGTVLRYEYTGAGTTTLILVHEMGGLLETWNSIMPAMSRDRQVLRYDLRGSGLSEKVRGALSIDMLADDLQALIDRLEIPKPIAVAGCAVGAAVSLHFAARHPECIDALVAMSPSTGLDADRRKRALAHADRLEREGLRATFDPEPPAGFLAPTDPTERLRCRRLGNDPQGVAALWRMLADLEIDDDFPRIRCPTLVLAGRRDLTRPPVMVERIARAIPGARFQVLETGHVMPVETPDLVATTLLDFLAETGL